jgi:hypothetical protein
MRDVHEKRDRPAAAATSYEKIYLLATAPAPRAPSDQSAPAVASSVNGSMPIAIASSADTSCSGPVSFGSVCQREPPSSPTAVHSSQVRHAQPRVKGTPHDFAVTAHPPGKVGDSLDSPPAVVAVAVALRLNHTLRATVDSLKESDRSHEQPADTPSFCAQGIPPIHAPRLGAGGWVASAESGGDESVNICTTADL